MPETEPEFDVVIVGSGIAGALAAYRLAQARPQLRVLMIEAGGVAPDSLGRYALARSYMASPTKLPDSPFCGDDILAPQPNQAIGKPYYDYDPDPKKSDLFKKLLRAAGGGIHLALAGHLHPHDSQRFPDAVSLRRGFRLADHLRRSGAMVRRRRIRDGCRRQR